MVKIIDSKEIITIDQARNKHTKSKAIFVITDMKDMTNMRGCIYAVSTDPDSFDELCDESIRLRKQNYQVIVIGSYGNGDGLGVQFEVK